MSDTKAIIDEAAALEIKRQRQRERNKRWYALNRDKALAKAREWYFARMQQCPDVVRKYHREMKAARRASDPQRAYEARKAIRLKSLDRDRELQRKWAKENREKRIATLQRYRARKRGADGDVTSAELRTLRAKHGKRCASCGASGRMTIDHIKPLAKGGSHKACNIQFLCGACNSAKGARDPIEWARLNGRLC